MLQAFFPAPTIVGFASGATFPDTLAADARLGAQGAPLLLAPPTGPLPIEVSARLRANPRTITAIELYGGDTAIGADVEQTIEGLLGA